MLRLFAKLAGVISVALTSCVSGDDAQVERISDNLSVVVGPITEDAQGHREAATIRRCATLKAVEAWTANRVDELDRELSVYAESVNEAVQSFELSLDLFEPGGSIYPSPNNSLSGLLEDFTVFIEICEEEVGGRGVEF